MFVYIEINVAHVILSYQGNAKQNGYSEMYFYSSLASYIENNSYTIFYNNFTRMIPAEGEFTLHLILVHYRIGIF